MTGPVDWIAVDWGTTHLRAWAMSNSGTVIDTRRSNRGMGGLMPEDFGPVLLDLISDWTEGQTTVIACGMVGSRQGWKEAAYATVPCPARPERLERVSASDTLTVHIVPGIKQTRPADVMRGEETQIAGFLALNPGWDGVLCLPGSHTKWAEVSAGEVVSFQTFMTGEVFSALSNHTVLRHTVGPSDPVPDAFAEALSDVMSSPQRLTTRLFGLRAADLLDGLPKTEATARLSGYLIGLELAGAKPYWLGRQIAIIGTGNVAAAYAAALSLQGVPAIEANGDRMTLAGLTAAWRSLKETAT